MPGVKKRTNATAASMSLANGADASAKLDHRGRPLRSTRNKTTNRNADSPFVDSALAISDSEDTGNEVEDDGEVIRLARPRKRKRSLSPPASPLSNGQEVLSDSTDSDVDDLDRLLAQECPEQGTTIHLTINVPVGQREPIKLHIDPRVGRRLAIPKSPQSHILEGKIALKSKDLSLPRNPNRKGFLDLPAELRNGIYRLVFVTEDESIINFAQPTNLSRTAALLRTCSQVHDEGRSILYADNKFHFERRPQRGGSLWELEWKEVGFLTGRKFLQSIGHANVGLLRHVTFKLEDAVPCLNPHLGSGEERRFVHDFNLHRILRSLARHACLETLTLHFHGRRRIERSDDEFLSLMCRLRADQVKFTKWPPTSEWGTFSKHECAVEDLIIATCVRRKKFFEHKEK